MPKVIRDGSKPPAYAPLPGLQFHCPRCGAVLETVEDEQVYQPATLEGPPDLPFKHGWRIPCPCCAHNIFVEEPEPVLISKLHGAFV